jgi:cyclopropane fatty-acyl-phospholipid synthase-like methyltransferase
MTIADRYTGDEYITSNPDWHVADSPWKAAQILAMLKAEPVETICEVGCGAGEILRQLHDRMPATRRLVGYEIADAPLAMAAERATERLSFELMDAADNDEVFDLMLIIDVIEHVADPISFLRNLRFKAKRTILHVPLDLSAQSVVRPGKLMSVREQVGHIHYFTPETAIATVQEAGYAIQGHVFTRSFDLEATTVKARLARIPRRLLPELVTVRLLGGYSILIDASNH